MAEDRLITVFFFSVRDKGFEQEETLTRGVWRKCLALTSCIIKCLWNTRKALFPLDSALFLGRKMHHINNYADTKNNCDIFKQLIIV